MRHRFHALCPYFAMFPESFVSRHLSKCERGAVVFDPFCGRGTTVLEALLQNYKAGGIDISPVAACISRAKANAPSFPRLISRLNDLERRYAKSRNGGKGAQRPEFFRWCFNAETYRQLIFLRSNLRWRASRVDCFIAALALWSLHGESHRSPNYFSNRMPRTISTKPEYSVRWWRRHQYRPPPRNVFEILARMARRRYVSVPPPLRAKIAETNARLAHKAFPELAGRVALVITSPPYLDVTNYQEDQWLRLWFLGGTSYPKIERDRDDRHTSAERYWAFLTECWRGVAPLLKPDAKVVVRIGGKYLRPDSVREKLHHTLCVGLNRRVTLLSHEMSAMRGGQRRTFHSNSRGLTREFDFVFAIH